ncbi:hypothetical protein CDL15_Pgr001474 [Punica granatum]|uniref:Uncharacterized protein n=1 Tax=Punica granatum TaxID=22663 RepID=A0A218WLX1_PUNGR|nr:hypothetical protein CDL15_Pgr001474 [Punica granatum]PKI57698.1 hypothetical protein CRG98_021910 [Punica granatum]
MQKDSWSEEEERLLVEAHEKIGNRWAEIAKDIPGRTENTIKNHWNAAKRRQNSRRKNKATLNKPDPHPSVLEDYIRRKNLSAKPSTTNAALKSAPIQGSTANAAVTASGSGSTLSDEPWSNEEPTLNMLPELSGIADYDEELLFMQKFFTGNFHQPLLGPTQLLLPALDSCNTPQSSNISVSNSNHEPSFLHPNLFVPYLPANEAPSAPAIQYYGFEDKGLMHLNDSQAPTCTGKREVDLMQVASSSQLSRSGD